MNFRHSNTSMQAKNYDFLIFWVGQTISNLGSSFTIFALPLLIFKLTGSAFDMGLAMAVTFLPYLLFGLPMGAWADRMNRKRLMMLSDLARALLLVSIPCFSALNILSIWWIYLVMFATSTLGICFNAAQAAAIPSLASGEDLLKANGRIQASYSATMVIGPILAGLLITTISIPMLLICDTATFVVSALSFVLIRRDLNVAQPSAPKKLSADIAEGLRYVLGHPVLRTIALLTGILSFTGSTIEAQIILFAKHQYQISDAQVGLFFSAGGLGVVALSLPAGIFRRYWSFSQVALGAAILKGLILIALALSPWYWIALLLWAISEGLSILFSINTLSLRQTIVPSHLLGRVQTIGQVIAWSAIPLGTFLGGLVIEWTGNVGLVYTLIGVINFLIAVLFTLTPLAHAERYLPATESTQTQVLLS